MQNDKDIIQQEEVLEDKKPKLKANEWLLSKDFIYNRTTYKNKEYLILLGDVIFTYKNICPINFITTYNDKYKTIYFMVGKHKKWFYIDENIAPFDFVELVKNKFLFQFYPKYSCKVNVEKDLNDNEIINEIEKGKSLNNVLSSKKVEKVSVFGYIEKIKLQDDEFMLIENDKVELRRSGNGSLNNAIILSEFLDIMRDLDKKFNNDEEKRNWVLNNSKFLRKIEFHDIEINYHLRWLQNFIKIRFEKMKNIPFIELNPLTYRWGNFIINFKNEIQEMEILGLLKSLKEHDGLLNKRGFKK